jgi:hypothetical protein
MKELSRGELPGTKDMIKTLKAKNSISMKVGTCTLASEKDLVGASFYQKMKVTRARRRLSIRGTLLLVCSMDVLLMINFEKIIYLGN